MASNEESEEFTKKDYMKVAEKLAEEGRMEEAFGMYRKAGLAEVKARIKIDAAIAAKKQEMKIKRLKKRIK